MLTPFSTLALRLNSRSVADARLGRHQVPLPAHDTGAILADAHTGIMIFAIGLLYAGLFHQDISTYIPPLAIGIIVWNFFIGAITEGCTVFIAASGYIKAYTIPLPIYALRLLWRNIIIFLHNALIIVIVWVVFRWQLFRPVVVGDRLCGHARFGDRRRFVLRCLMHPISRYSADRRIRTAAAFLYYPDYVGAWLPGIHRWIADYNPLFSIIEIVRAPLLN